MHIAEQSFSKLLANFYRWLEFSQVQAIIFLGSLDDYVVTTEINVLFGVNYKLAEI